jgi:hypothetical protein
MASLEPDTPPPSERGTPFCDHWKAGLGLPVATTWKTAVDPALTV